MTTTPRDEPFMFALSPCHGCMVTLDRDFRLLDTCIGCVAAAKEAQAFIERSGKRTKLRSV